MIDWQPRVRRLTATLTADRVLTDPDWRETVEVIPRHLFVPRFYRGSSDTVVDGGDPAAYDEWLDAVYSDDSLATKRAQVPGSNLSWSISSSTMPSLMVRMLQLLDVSPGHRVLEIGTGTGYNAALLCHRLGEANVTSIDIDPELVATARTRLTQLGFRPHLAVGDGAAGVAERAPYDRIIATCAVSTVPPAWIRQLAAGGLIVADLRGEISSTLAVLHKTDPATVRGMFLTAPGHFMWLRARADNPLRDGGSRTARVVDLDHINSRPTPLGPAQLHDADLRFALQLHLPNAEGLFHLDRDPPTVQLRTTDGSWAEVSADTTTTRVTEGGPGRIWSIAEHAADWWERRGRPTRSRFGLTATVDGAHRLWLDHPDSPHSWPLPL
jgi:methyltransferase of ATP-grasp peptide maturase system